MKFKDGEVYKCTTSDNPAIFKVGEFYPTFEENGDIGIFSAHNIFWTESDLMGFGSGFNFELIGGDPTKKEFDLNKLSERELIQYAYLLEDHLDAKDVLDDFIEEHSK